MKKMLCTCILLLCPAIAWAQESNARPAAPQANQVLTCGLGSGILLDRLVRGNFRTQPIRQFWFAGRGFQQQQQLDRLDGASREGIGDGGRSGRQMPTSNVLDRLDGASRGDAGNGGNGGGFW